MLRSRENVAKSLAFRSLPTNGRTQAPLPKEAVPVCLAPAGKPGVLDTAILMDRNSGLGRRVITLQAGYIQAVLDKPRTAYVFDLASVNAAGCPVFLPDGKVVGLVLLNFNNAAPRNGDKLTGVLALGPIELATLVGPVKIGIEHIRRIKVVLSGGSLADRLKQGLLVYYAFDKGAGQVVSPGRHAQGRHVYDLCRWRGSFDGRQRTAVTRCERAADDRAGRGVVRGRGAGRGHDLRSRLVASGNPGNRGRCTIALARLTPSRPRRAGRGGPWRSPRRAGVSFAPAPLRERTRAGFEAKAARRR